MTTHFHKATVLYDLGRYAEALIEFQIARTELVDDEHPVWLAAFCYYFMHKYKKGLDLAKVALTLNPESVQSHQIHGLCLTALGKEKQAQLAFEKALQINPEDGFSHYYFAFFLSEKRSWVLALQEVETALTYEPSNSVMLAFRSKALTVLGKKEESRSATLEALRLDPEDPHAHAQHGLVLRIDGDVIGAMKAYREALRNNPNDREALEGLMDAVRSRFIVYRWLLNFELQIQRMSSKTRSLLTIVPITLARLAVTSSFQEMDPSTRTSIRVAGALYLFFLISTWFAPVFMDALSALDSEMKYVLTRPQRIWATGLAILFLISACSLVIGFGFHIQLAMLFSIVLSICFLGFGVRYRIKRW